MVFVYAAGNDARRHDEADFVDAGDGFHALDGDSDTSLRVFGASAGAILQWNDPFGASGNNYDMYMCPSGLRPVKFNLQNRICRASDRVQDGDDDPVEGVILLDSGFADIYIRKFSGGDRRLELLLENQFGSIREHGVPEGSVIAHPAAAGVLAVGAISAADPGNDDAHSYSDRGPSIFIDPDDNEKTVSRNKPDVMGIDNVLVTGAGGFGFPTSGDRGSVFPGTSAAAPHLTGNTIRKNSIHTNTGHGIDQGDDGATANDTGDADTGPNSLRNYPTDITFAVRDDAAASRFKIDSTRSQRYIVDYYGCDSSSCGEGKEWLGFYEFRAPFTDTIARTVDTFRGELEEYSAPTGTHVTATVTELQTDSTSEFAPCVEMVDLPELDLSVSRVEVNVDSTTETTYSIAL